MQELWKNNDNYYPMLVSDSEINPNMTVYVAYWMKLKTVPEKTRDILMSNDLPKIVYSTAERIGLTDGEVRNFSRLIRRYMFNDITDDTFKEVARTEYSFPEAITDDFFSVIKNNILTLEIIKPREKEKNDENDDAFTFADSDFIERAHRITYKIVHMPLSAALKKYPKIIYQRVTGEPLILKFSKDIQLPTLKNWITNYEQILGSGKHDSIERGNFLFHSQNAKKLSTGERVILEAIFKSLNDGDQLPINTDLQQIALDKIKPLTSKTFSESNNNSMAKSTDSEALDIFDKNYRDTGAAKQENTAYRKEQATAVSKKTSFDTRVSGFAAPSFINTKNSTVIKKLPVGKKILALEDHKKSHTHAPFGNTPSRNTGNSGIQFTSGHKFMSEQKKVHNPATAKNNTLQKNDMVPQRADIKKTVAPKRPLSAVIRPSRYNAPEKEEDGPRITGNIVDLRE